eukprot:TRINITY_DN902_c1_g1_i1.p1 TRINITY_DN902_c1_g1~~TRINITY_DN902_c1_g1_i1.p1  ORF type:complete len:1277 (+),score=205.22 TRINITY_DN902_c1_g1_i1:762-4592(+)
MGVLTDDAIRERSAEFLRIFPDVEQNEYCISDVVLVIRKKETTARRKVAGNVIREMCEGDTVRGGLLKATMVFLYEHDDIEAFRGDVLAMAWELSQPVGALCARMEDQGIDGDECCPFLQRIERAQAKHNKTHNPPTPPPAAVAVAWVTSLDPNDTPLHDVVAMLCGILLVEDYQGKGYAALKRFTSHSTNLELFTKLINNSFTVCLPPREDCTAAQQFLSAYVPSTIVGSKLLAWTLCMLGSDAAQEELNVSAPPSATKRRHKYRKRNVLKKRVKLVTISSTQASDSTGTPGPESHDDDGGGARFVVTPFTDSSRAVVNTGDSILDYATGNMEGPAVSLAPVGSAEVAPPVPAPEEAPTPVVAGRAVITRTQTRHAEQEPDTQSTDQLQKTALTPIETAEQHAALAATVATIVAACEPSGQNCDKSQDTEPQNSEPTSADITSPASEEAPTPVVAGREVITTHAAQELDSQLTEPLQETDPVPVTEVAATSVSTQKTELQGHTRDQETQERVLEPDTEPTSEKGAELASPTPTPVVDGREVTVVEQELDTQPIDPPQRMVNVADELQAALAAAVAVSMSAHDSLNCDPSTARDEQAPVLKLTWDGSEAALPVVMTAGVACVLLLAQTPAKAQADEDKRVSTMNKLQEVGNAIEAPTSMEAGAAITLRDYIVHAHATAAVTAAIAAAMSSPSPSPAVVATTSVATPPSPSVLPTADMKQVKHETSPVMALATAFGSSPRRAAHGCVESTAPPDDFAVQQCTEDTTSSSERQVAVAHPPATLPSSCISSMYRVQKCISMNDEVAPEEPHLTPPQNPAPDLAIIPAASSQVSFPHTNHASSIISPRKVESVTVSEEVPPERVAHEDEVRKILAQEAAVAHSKPNSLGNKVSLADHRTVTVDEVVEALSNELDTHEEREEAAVSKVGAVGVYTLWGVAPPLLTSTAIEECEPDVQIEPDTESSRDSEQATPVVRGSVPTTDLPPPRVEERVLGSAVCEPPQEEVQQEVQEEVVLQEEDINGSSQENRSLPEPAPEPIPLSEIAAPVHPEPVFVNSRPLSEHEQQTVELYTEPTPASRPASQPYHREAAHAHPQEPYRSSRSETVSARQRQYESVPVRSLYEVEREFENSGYQPGDQRGEWLPSPVASPQTPQVLATPGSYSRKVATTYPRSMREAYTDDRHVTSLRRRASVEVFTAPLRRHEMYGTRSHVRAHAVTTIAKVWRGYGGRQAAMRRRYAIFGYYRPRLTNSYSKCVSRLRGSTYRLPCETYGGYSGFSSMY